MLFRSAELMSLGRDTVVEVLVDSGQWTALRTRPYSKVPGPDTTPDAIFVTAADTRPLCGDPSLFINEQADAYLAGIDVLSRLTDGPVFVCTNAGSTVPVSDNPQVKAEQFAGPHPSGNAGTHIHFQIGRAHV